MILHLCSYLTSCLDKGNVSTLFLPHNRMGGPSLIRYCSLPRTLDPVTPDEGSGKRGKGLHTLEIETVTRTVGQVDQVKDTYHWCGPFEK